MITKIVLITRKVCNMNKLIDENKEKCIRGDAVCTAK